MLLILCKNSWHPENPSLKVCNISFAKYKKKKNKWEEAPHTKLRAKFTCSMHLQNTRNLTWLNNVGSHSALCHMLGLLAINRNWMLNSKKSPAHVHKQGVNLSWGYSSLVHFLFMLYSLATNMWNLWKFSSTVLQNEYKRVSTIYAKWNTHFRSFSHWSKSCVQQQQKQN